MKVFLAIVLADIKSLPGFLQAVAPILDDYGYLAVGLFIMLQNISIPFIPAWTTLMAASIYAGAGKLNVIALGLVAVTFAIIGSNIGFFVGRYGGELFVLKYGRYFFLTSKRLRNAHKFLDNYGAPILALGPFVNSVLRQLSGIVAGTAEMRWRKFVIYNAIGAFLWVSIWVTVGYEAGSHISTIYKALIYSELYFLVLFGAYAIGRVSHILGGHLKAPHHWIYGMISLILGIVSHNHALGIYLILFGIGHTISDLKDMVDLKFYGRDEPGPKKFWGID